jgi:hypothetical protein
VTVTLQSESRPIWSKDRSSRTLRGWDARDLATGLDLRRTSTLKRSPQAAAMELPDRQVLPGRRAVILDRRGPRGRPGPRVRLAQPVLRDPPVPAVPVRLAPQEQPALEGLRAHRAVPVPAAQRFRQSFKTARKACGQPTTADRQVRTFLFP